MKELIKDVDDHKKRNYAETVMEMFEKNVLPKIPSLRKGIIHGDCNGMNIIVQKNSSDHYQIAGLIDFSDSLNTCTIFDLGVCLAYIMLENLDPSSCPNVAEFVGPILRGYTNAYPITQEEFDSLYYIIMARCVQSAVNGEHLFKAEPWNLYVLTTPNKAWKLIETFLNMTKSEVDKIWMKYWSN